MILYQSRKWIWAISSVGQSHRLITGRSGVRVPDGPPHLRCASREPQVFLCLRFPARAGKFFISDSQSNYDKTIPLYLSAHLRFVAARTFFARDKETSSYIVKTRCGAQAANRRVFLYFRCPARAGKLFHLLHRAITTKPCRCTYPRTRVARVFFPCFYLTTCQYSMVIRGMVARHSMVETILMALEYPASSW